MKKSLNLTGILLFILAAISFFGFSQPLFSFDKSRELLAKSNLFNLRFPQEKIYLHLDRQTYLAEDDIWFKAYILNSPITNCNLYVELINSSGDVIYKNITWSQNGLAYGDFQLADTITSGMYQIRAYTNWMRNFGNDWFFRKNLLIINPRYGALFTDSVKLRKRDIDLQFFPEGGTFLVNQKSKVAFKAIDENGKGIDVQGEIVDNDGRKIADFRSTHKGIGSFIIEPEPAKKYSANVNVANQFDLNVDLPGAQPYGVSLSIDATDTASVFLKVSENKAKSELTSENKYLIVGQAGGSICFVDEVSLPGETGSFKIDKNTLPGGIIKFTLFDQNSIPRCERLVFNNHLDTIHVEINAEKQMYKPREKVQLEIKVLNNDGSPCLANLSMAVCKSEADYKTEEYPDNIFTRFLISSELRGTIEEPAYYFKDHSLATITALDNVMLTHGYRYFEWEEIRDGKEPEIKFQPDSCITVKGRVISTLLGKPLEDCKVNMIKVKSLLDIYETKTDSLGRFQFSNLYFKDTAQFSIQARTRKNRKTTWIELDEEIRSPEAHYLPSVYKSYGKGEVQTHTFLSELSPELLMKKWHLSDTILLGDVNVLAKKQEEDDGYTRPYTKSDYSFDVKTMDLSSNSVFETISMSSAIARAQLSRSEAFFLDGMPVESGFLADIRPTWVDKVEFVKMYPVGRKYVTATFIYLKRGMKNAISPTKPLGMESARVTGYSVFRKFYSPKYRNNENQEVKTDFRSTLYWDPLVRTDKRCKTQVTFYNSDEVGKVNIVVEGINSDGKLCRGLAGYDIEH